jgi:hypothetical protein
MQARGGKQNPDDCYHNYRNHMDLLISHSGGKAKSHLRGLAAAFPCLNGRIPVPIAVDARTRVTVGIRKKRLLAGPQCTGQDNQQANTQAAHCIHTLRSSFNDAILASTPKRANYQTQSYRHQAVCLFAIPQSRSPGSFAFCVYLLPTHHRDSQLIGPRQKFLLLEHDRPPHFQHHRPAAVRVQQFHRGHSHGGHVETHVLVGVGGFA